MIQTAAALAKSKTLRSLEGFSLKQGKTELIVVKFRAGDLVAMNATEVEVLEKGNPDGYQRELKAKRVKAIRDFVLQGNPIPPALILSARSKPVLVSKGVYEFQLPLIIIDGQHRHGGLLDAIAANPDFKDFEIVCVVYYVGNAFEKEAKLFVDINRSQRVVSNDLTVVTQYNLSKTEAGKRLIANDAVLNERQDVQTRAYKVALALNSDGGMLPVRNPLQGRIKLLVEDKPAFKNPISQQSVVRSLERVVDNENLDLRSATTSLLAYWRGAYMTWKKDVENPSESLILRNIGVEVLHRVYPFVLSKVLALKGDPTNPEHYNKVLALAVLPNANPSLAQSFWKEYGRVGKAGGGMGTFSLIAADIIKAISDNFWTLERTGL